MQWTNKCNLDVDGTQLIGLCNRLSHTLPATSFGYQTQSIHLSFARPWQTHLVWWIFTLVAPRTPSSPYTQTSHILPISLNHITMECVLSVVHHHAKLIEYVQSCSIYLLSRSFFSSLQFAIINCHRYRIHRCCCLRRRQSCMFVVLWHYLNVCVVNIGHLHTL